MKKILFIDFGYIMYPCVKKYANYLNAPIDKNSTTFWDEISKAIDVRTDLVYDAVLYKQICEFLFNQKKSGTQILIEDDHIDVAYSLSDINEEVNATIIDFYSGFANNGNEVDIISLQHKINETSWLSYLIMHNIVTSVIWYKTPQSESIHQELNPIAKNTSEKFLYDLNTALSDKYDLIYLTCSPNVVPYQFKHLYDVLTYALKI